MHALFGTYHDILRLGRNLNRVGGPAAAGLPVTVTVTQVFRVPASPSLDPESAGVTQPCTLPVNLDPARGPRTHHSIALVTLH